MDKIDVIIIGAGIAGIQSAYYIQKNCPHLSYKILESRSDLGGTWDLMKYPGVRSDCDMYTYGYSFNPWHGTSIASGEEIKDYIDQTAERFDIKQHIKFNQSVKTLDWIKNSWVVNNQIQAKYVICCTGYYDYDNVNLPSIDKQELYQGTIVHPQHWNNTDFKHKDVAIVGSGCTAITMLPKIAEQAKSVTLIQRSPGWITSIDSKERSTRLKKTLQSLKNYFYCRLFKNKIKEKFKANHYYTPDRIPSYDVWDQRVCCTTDWQYFTAMNKLNVRTETSEIYQWKPQGLMLTNNKIIKSDITIMATGFNIKLLGDIEITVNGKPININESSWYKGMMYSGVPNLFSMFGYVNFSWTARCELISKRISKIINYMTKKKLQTCTPKYLGKTTPPPLQSNYILRAMNKFPRKTYKFSQNYFKEWITFKWSKINDGAVEFK